ncbi:hypothetical protein BH09MYX1_BH09MYX1_47560 [soil metagenome]
MGRGSIRRRLIGGIAFIAIALLSCQAILGITPRDELTDNPDSSSGDADVEASTDLCGSRGLPERPAETTSSPSDAVKVIAALRTVDLGLDAGDGYGFNLDRVCTCPGVDGCKRPDTKHICDGVNGIDNGGRSLFRAASNLGLVREKELNATIQQGISGVFLRVDGWNGTPTDAKVRVSIYASLGFSADASASPQFDGNDVWTVDEGSVLGSDVEKPKYFADDAYVTNGSLVVPSLDFPITVGGASSQPAVTLELSDGVIQAKLSTVNGITQLDGVIAGRWPAKTLLTGLQVFYDPNDPNRTPFCGDSGLYQIFKDFTCSLVDIPRSPSIDNTAAPCDALAIGIRFIAVAAKLGPIVAHPDSGAPCGQGYSDSCF